MTRARSGSPHAKADIERDPRATEVGVARGSPCPEGRSAGALTAAPLDDAERSGLLCWNMVVPPAVRAACVEREVDADDVLAAFTLPVLVSHSCKDLMALPSMAEHVLALCPSAEASWYDDTGHMPFLERPERFNAELAAFARC